MKIIRAIVVIVIIVFGAIGFFKNSNKDIAEVSPQDIYIVIEDCLDNMSFSKQTLSNVLLVNGFTQKEINDAFSTLNINWKEQAMLKAEQYLFLMNLSENSLREQLKYEGFTDEEINYVIKNILLKK